ncbi:CPBP family intramembrane glutamic endopeptidase [Faecalicatena contorta]|uniref:CPBP family intramembrane glutamic endopeptidase n=1 Tax=Faecalicatena contorta TaxID=39482 RepID=UPI001F3E4C86|nr:CPBP family intramembrane glutamic endopeptidase [Faecalicatena contorta]MCF2683353.1 CPBP family intramembrane metalloprotease [Faecalicatena contorta]
MEQQQSRQTPPISQESYGKRFWELWGPILIKWAIGIGVGMAAMIALMMVYIGTHYTTTEALNSLMDNQDKMMELYGKIVVKYMDYSTIVEGVAALVTIPVMAVMFHKDRVKERIQGVIPNRKAPIWKYAAIVIMALAMSLGLNNLIIIGNLSAVDETYATTMNALYSAPLILQIVCLAVLVPICEEYVFRGLFFQRMRARTSYRYAAIYSSLVFGMLHMNLIQMIYGFILGLMLTYVYEKYGSLKAPIIAHMSMNLLSVLATQFQMYDWLVKNSVRMGVITVLCATVSATMYVWMQRIEEKPENPGQKAEDKNLAV